MHGGRSGKAYLILEITILYQLTGKRGPATYNASMDSLLFTAIKAWNAPAVLQQLASGSIPGSADMVAAVSPSTENKYQGHRDYVYHPDVVKALVPYLTKEVYDVFQETLAGVAAACKVGLVGCVSGADEVQRIFDQIIETEPLRLEFSEAPNCFVGLSGVHGEGLFAGRAFSVGETVADYGTSFLKWFRVPYANLDALPHVHDRSWFVGESLEFCRVASPTSVFMRANHARQPNTGWNPAARRLTATQPIAAGDEITYDYRLEVGPPSLKDHPPAWA